MTKILEIALALGLTCATTQAATIFNFTMSGAQEVPGNVSTAIGSGMVTLSTDQLTLDINMSFSGLSVPGSAAHIHCCTPAGANASVRIDFGSAGFPTGVTSGSYAHTFTLATAVTGITPAFFVAELLAGHAYVNIHDANFTGGEIRAQLNPTPEPGTLALFGAGLAGLAALRRRRGVVSSSPASLR